MLNTNSVANSVSGARTNNSEGPSVTGAPQVNSVRLVAIRPLLERGG